MTDVHAGDAFGRQFARRVERHTREAEARWADAGGYSRLKWAVVLTEEVGKLVRACNKLTIARDPAVRRTWRVEGRHRLVSIASCARRMAERWDDLEDGG